MVEEFCGYLQAPIGGLKITCSQEMLCGVEFTDLLCEDNRNPLVQQTIHQLQEYFEGKRVSFDLPIYFSGTEFQKKAWSALLQIPFGETISYKEQALRIGNPKAARAIGGANNKNKIAIIIPCHRVVGQNVDLVGYAGGLDKKMWLLEHEKRIDS